MSTLKPCRILVANRGEIALRAMRTIHRLELQSVAIYSEADHASAHVDAADFAYAVGPGAVAESYLQQQRILDVALQCGATAVFPGYGLLSENAAFAEKCEALGLHWLGPTPQQMQDFGLKHEARRMASAASVPLVPGSGLLLSVEQAKCEAARLGYPVMLKSSAGGGGIGMKRCDNAAELQEAFTTVQRLSERSFGGGGLFLERFISRGRHIEVQIFGDGRGRVLALGERDCSVQRRNQKVIEETPAVQISEDTRRALHAAAVSLGESIHYRSAGTVEFIYDAQREEFYFLEVNTRLQVEHGVTELVTGIDLVEWMLRLALDPDWQLPESAPKANGHAIQVRLYAEDPQHQFRPCAGLLTEVHFPTWTRCDTWVNQGTEVSALYDPLLAKIMVHAPNRLEAVTMMHQALAETRLFGLESNLRYLRQIIEWENFRNGGVAMQDMEHFCYRPQTMEVLSAGTMTTVQEWPGRLGLWEVGVPPSGPFDALSFRAANCLVGNAEGCAALEITMTGPTLRFHVDAVIAVTGADVELWLNNEEMAQHEAIKLSAGDVLKIGRVMNMGVRCYLAVAGGIDNASYLGSGATFTLGQFGGPFGRALRAGDVMGISRADTMRKHHLNPLKMSHRWQIGVLYGPHGAPDFFLPEDIQQFFSTSWKVHYNSARTGVRLIGPRPQWARTDGGEAGLHPSNLHDNAYAIGAVDFTGDMPVILGPDGPSLGGFVCPAVVVDAELWKLGQLRPGDELQFIPVSPAWAAEQSAQLKAYLQGLRIDIPQPEPAEWGDCVLDNFGSGDESVWLRRAGDRYLLIEFGPPQLDLKLRFKAHVIDQWIREQSWSGLIDITPGIRSLQLHFDPSCFDAKSNWQLIREKILSLPPLEEMAVPARIVSMPVSWDDPSTREAIQRYMQGVRADAPWCPSNLEFIRRINGLADLSDVQKIFFSASYLVMGLGDVYLGAPVATPLDPRHRLVTTKYNPARTWTPENAVGIGGAYLCIYGMEGPGGYQFTGRTLPVWNRWRRTRDFEKPWLLRFFDQLRFYPVAADELLEMRRDFILGRHQLDIEPTIFRFGEYQQFLQQEADSIAEFRASQRVAFEEERLRWEEAGWNPDAEDEIQVSTSALEILPDCWIVESPVSGNVWKCDLEVGQRFEKNDKLAVLEAMKMEIDIEAESSIEIVQVLVKEGRSIQAGDAFLVVRAAEHI